jgi:hypothetical protein
MSLFGLEELNIPFQLRNDPARLAQKFSTEFHSRADYENSSNVCDDLNTSPQWAQLILAHQHFGFPASIDLCVMLESCSKIAVEFFFGEWRLRQKDERTGQLAFTEDEYRRYMDSSWFLPYTRGVFLCMLGNHWEQARKISSWLQSDLDMDYQGDLEPEIGKIIISMAASIASNKNVDLRPLALEVAKTRKKRPKLLFDLLNAVCERDQRAFDVALTANLKHFASRKPDQWEMCDDWIAWYPSTLCLYGNHLGLKTPDLPRNLAIRLITRQSVGLE